MERCLACEADGEQGQFVRDSPYLFQRSIWQPVPLHGGA